MQRTGMVHFSFDFWRNLPEMGSMTLAEYLARASLSRPQFARKIGVSPETVRRYIDCGRVPTPRIMAKIIGETDGKVTADDFFKVAA